MYERTVFGDMNLDGFPFGLASISVVTEDQTTNQNKYSSTALSYLQLQNTVNISMKYSPEVLSVSLLPSSNSHFFLKFSSLISRYKRI